MICEVNVLKFERSEEGKDTGCNLSTDFQRSIFTIATSLELADFAKLDVECVSEQLNFILQYERESARHVRLLSWMLIAIHVLQVLESVSDCKI